MRLLLVLAHPTADSFNASVAQAARETLQGKGHAVDWLDLYAEDFDPRLTSAERATYFTDPYDASAVAPLIERLRAADGLVLVFPQWWFGFPAILKGFFDRIFAPGVAFAHSDSGGILRGLTNIRLLYALTTTGSPWWVTKLVGDPVHRTLRRVIAPMCAKGLRFRMISLHDMDRASGSTRRAHVERVRRLMSGI